MAWDSVTVAPGNAWSEVSGAVSATWVPAEDWVLVAGVWDDAKNWNDTGVWVDAPLVWNEVGR